MHLFGGNFLQQRCWFSNYTPLYIVMAIDCMEIYSNLNIKWNEILFFSLQKFRFDFFLLSDLSFSNPLCCEPAIHSLSRFSR